MIWIAFALLTGVAVVSVLWPLTGPPPERCDDVADVAFYRAQIAEIDAEMSRGGVTSDAADAAKAQAARRLLAAARQEAATGGSPLAQTIAIVLVSLGVPILALALYARAGRPDLPDLPLQARQAPAAASPGLAEPVAKMEAFLASHPKDGRALELTAPTFMQLGRYDDAAKAMREAIDILGETPDRLAKYGEALSYANDGVVSPEAVDQFERALALDAHHLLARYYLGLAAAQHDDAAKAREIWTAMLPEMPDGAPAKKDVLDKLALLDAPGDGPDAATPEVQRDQTIRAMVDKLAERLAAQGGTADDWMRLMRSWQVLKEPAKAQDAYDRARTALAGDAAAQRALADLARELGLNDP